MMRPGHRADVGAAMAANLRFVAHAPQRNPRELAAQGVGHALAEGGLAHAGRPDETENRAFDFLAALEDREEFQQAVLDFAQAEMLFVQDFFRRFQIQLVLGGFFPRQIQNPVQVVARHAIFGGGGRRLLETFQFLFGGLARLGGHRRLLDFFAQRFDFAAVGVAIAEFALDGAHLFAQEEIPLRLGDGGGDVALDFGT